MPPPVPWLQFYQRFLESANLQAWLQTRRVVAEQWQVRLRMSCGGGGSCLLASEHLDPGGARPCQGRLAGRKEVVFCWLQARAWHEAWWEAGGVLNQPGAHHMQEVVAVEEFFELEQRLAAAEAVGQVSLCWCPKHLRSVQRALGSVPASHVELGWLVPCAAADRAPSPHLTSPLPPLAPHVCSRLKSWTSS